MTLLLLAFYLSFILVAFMLPHIMILSLRKRLIDPITSRKVHTITASRLGGVAFFPAILLSVWLTIAISDLLFPLFGLKLHISNTTILETLALLLLFLVGVYDDILGVSYRKKFIVQIIAAILIISSGAYLKTLNGFLGIEHISPFIAIPLTLGLYVFVTNSINLIDGIDGLASIISIMALVVYSVLFYRCGMQTETILAVASMGALIPFCYSNLLGIKHGAHSRIFMGDTGSLVVGTIVGYLSISIWNISDVVENRLYATMAYTMLIVPGFDVIRVMIHRYRSRRAIFKPDKSHIHHKIIATGQSPRQTLKWIITINIFFVILNILLSSMLSITYIFIIDIIVWSLIDLYISKKIKLN